VTLAIKAFAEKDVAAGTSAADGEIPTQLRTDRRGLLRRRAKT
jgi:hypothetical protein